MRWLLGFLLVLALCLPGAAWAAAETLPNGLRLLVQPDPNTEVVAAALFLRISSSDDPVDQAGVRYLTHRLLLRGANRDSGETLGDRLTDAGGSIDEVIGLDYVELHIVVPADGFETALGVLAEAVRDPAFLPEEVEKERRKALDALHNEREDAFQSAYLALRDALYPKGPYGRSTLGAAASLHSLTRDQVVAFYHRHYGPRRAILSIAGGVEAPRAAQLARRVFGDWSADATGPQPASAALPLDHSFAVAREVPARQAYVILGFPAPSACDPQYATFQVIDSLLSGGSGGRLSRALRDRSGLAYQIASFYPTLAGRSHFGVYVATEPEHVERVKGVVLHELDRLRDEPVSAEELTRAKRYLLGSYAMSHQEAYARAYGAAWYELLGLGPDFEAHYQEAVMAVTSDQVQAASQDLIRFFVAALALPGE